MAFDNDKSFLVPEPPPPRPARRDAAIEAALRRFDGIEDQPSAAADRQRATSPPAMSWTRKYRPQFGVLVSATLIAVIGLPAALIAIRDRPPTPAREVASPTAAESQQDLSPCAARDCTADGAAASEKQGAPPSAERVVAAPDVAPPVHAAAPIRAEQGDTVTPRANSQFAAREAASPPAAVAPAPPPPPPPAMAEKVAQKAMAGQVVVTGSRIAAPSMSSVGSDKLDRSANDAASRVATRAPDWVVQDRSYETFLTQLQTAVRADDRGAMVTLIGFPLRVNFEGRTRLYRDAQSVARDYSRIFTPKVRRAILNQRFDRLFGRDQGVMIGNGEVWFDHNCPNAECSAPGPVRIKSVNP
jgi:hypothetical protein